MYFFVYVDYIIVTGNNEAFTAGFISHLADRFALKDLEPLHHFLGVAVSPKADGMFLSQSQYVAD